MPVTAAAGFHTPVLASEIAVLAAGCRRAVDGTVGGGGHSQLLVETGAQVLAIDRDAEAVAAARARLGPDRAVVRQGRFGDPKVLAEIWTFRPDLVLLDLGVSSQQIDESRRGFSFRRGVPLDMRMENGAPGATAAELLNELPEEELARLFRENADEPRARRLARAVVARRARHGFAVSDDFVGAIRAALGARSGPSDFARLFQALRMEVNHERSELRDALPALRDALPPGGRLLVIAYHSGEDRMVKQAFRDWAQVCICPPRQPVCTCRGRALGFLDPRRLMRPSASEMAANPRSRSAILRGFRTADAP